MAEARPVSNAEMRELAGFGLSGKDRQGLVALDLIRSSKHRLSFVHELTEHGWHRSRELLRIGAIRGAGPTAGALSVLLAALDRGLQRTRQSPSAFFQLAPSDLEHAIRLAYKAHAKASGDWVRLTEIRSTLGHAGRADVDAALTRLVAQPDIRIAPVANLKSLSDDDRAAAIRLGGEMKHAIAIEG